MHTRSQSHQPKIGFTVRCQGDDDEVESVVTTNPSGKQTKHEVSRRKQRNTIETVVEILGASGLIAVLVIGTMCVVAIIQATRGSPITIPDYLSQFCLLILGYYFGQKSQTHTKNEHKQSIGFGHEN